MSTHIGFCWVEEPEFYDPFATRTLPCFSCRRSFATLDNLRQHLRSRVHLGRGIQCVFCDRGFTTASGVVHHLELGACPRAAGLDRDTIFGFMKNADPLGYVTNVVDQVEPGVFPKDRNGTQVYACTVCKMEYPTSDEAMRHVAAARESASPAQRWQVPTPQTPRPPAWASRPPGLACRLAGEQRQLRC